MNGDNAPVRCSGSGVTIVSVLTVRGNRAHSIDACCIGDHVITQRSNCGAGD